MNYAKLNVDRANNKYFTTTTVNIPIVHLKSNTYLRQHLRSRAVFSSENTSISTSKHHTKLV